MSLILIFCGFVYTAYAYLNSVDNTDENVIIESDAGGGDLTQRDLLWIIIGLLVLILLIVALS